VEGPCTWSKLKVCFLLVEGAAAVADAATPAPGGADEEPSTETVVADIACITALWNRAGMEVASCAVDGRIRRAERIQG